MIIRDAKLETVCGLSSVLPENDLMEIAFAGRSNVGKSSLINMIMNRKSLARTSSEPGKTRTVNYYRVDAFVRETSPDGKETRRENPFYLVDLPGYGYARVSRSESESWGKFIDGYLHGSLRLREIFLLLDIRRDPDERDRQMLEWIRSSAIDHHLLLTKADKLKRSQVSGRIRDIKRALSLGQGEEVMAVSAQSKTGLSEIYGIISAMGRQSGDDAEG